MEGSTRADSAVREMILPLKQEEVEKTNGEQDN